ncbi:Sec-independent protein translocase protein TatB [Thioalkalivibrio sp. ALE20]|uniref:Sec-independent protein translocase protein TatB n=1 Tax=Thioalkalivibrio sp. ALE20 TaxID=545275 RepID=UPI000362CA45|nr:Sec-independent protein translocase protein TatB [Thioalkalivibrio sp. ALE20]
MFDIGFWEILIIVVVALLVVGPERLPGLAREIGRFVGKTRRFVQSVRSDVEREFQTEELREMVKSQDREIRELKHMVEDTETSLREDLEQTEREINRELRDTDDTPADADSDAGESADGDTQPAKPARPAVRERRTPPEPAGRETDTSRADSVEDAGTQDSEAGSAPEEPAWDADGGDLERVPVSHNMGPDLATEDPALAAEREQRSTREERPRRRTAGRRPQRPAGQAPESPEAQGGDGPQETDTDHSPRTPDERP